MSATMLVRISVHTQLIQQQLEVILTTCIKISIIANFTMREMCFTLTCKGSHQAEDI